MIRVLFLLLIALPPAEGPAIRDRVDVIEHHQATYEGKPFSKEYIFWRDGQIIDHRCESSIVSDTWQEMHAEPPVLFWVEDVAGVPRLRIVVGAKWRETTAALGKGPNDTLTPPDRKGLRKK